MMTYDMSKDKFTISRFRK